MGDSIATPRQNFNAGSHLQPKDQLLSSSPGFGTPAYPIVERQKPAPRQPFAQPSTTSNVHTVLPIILPPQTLRPVAFRTLTKKHNLTLTSSGLGVLATFVGKFCGSGWREDGLAERVLDEIAKSWKRNGGGLIVEDGPDKKLSNILKTIEPCMSGGRLDTGKLSRQNSSVGSLSRSNSLVGRPEASRDDSQTSLGLSALNVEENAQFDQEGTEGSQMDPRHHLKIVSAFNQPRLIYSTSKKALEQISGPASLLPPIQHKISMFRNRYHLVHQRLLRNESFQTPAFSTANRPRTLGRSGSSAVTLQQAYKITPISNLLGRSGSSRLLLGMLVHSAAGDLALTDLTGSVVLDLSTTRPIPEDGAWFCPGMIVLVEGTYEEDGSNNSNLGVAAGVGGQIKGHFLAETMAGPPAERRNVTVGISPGLDPDSNSNNNAHTSVGSGFGWIDFLGIGSEKAMGSQMRRIQRRIFGAHPQSQTNTTSNDSNSVTAPHQEEDPHPGRTKLAILGECNLDSPRTLEAIRAIIGSYANASTDQADYPLSIVMMGNFVSAASMAGSAKGGGSVEYKEHFDALASILSEFPGLLSTTTFVFVPGDNDPWASSFSAGGACVIPRQGVPELFTSRIRRAFVTANTETARKEKTSVPGEAIWASNPARMSLFGPLEEIVLFRDDITSRFRRNAVTFSRPEGEDDDDDDHRAENNAAAGPGPEAETIDLEEPTDAQPNTTGLDSMVHEATSHVPSTTTTTSRRSTQANASLPSARKLIKTILDQSHLSPFAHSIRPVFWDHAGALSLYPLPTALVLADAETPQFAITYEGCHVMNPGRVVDELGARRGLARWIEFDVKAGRGESREVRF
jgi:DNA polymerase epsilon subunit 2